MSPTNSAQRGIPDDEMFLASSAGAANNNNNNNNRPDDDRESPVVGPLRISKPPSSVPTPQPAMTSSSSLPYPDDRAQLLRQQQQQQQQTPYPQTFYPPPTAGGRVASPPVQHHRVASPGSTPSPLDYPAALRPHEPRENKPSLAERRGNAPPKPLPESPITDNNNSQQLYQRFPPGPAAAAAAPPPPTNHQQQQPVAAEAANSNYNQQYFPPPPSGGEARLQPPGTSSINRISSTASTSTTRAQRGSPPPPETPVVGPNQQPGADIEARFAAAGIAGTSTLASLQSHNAAAQQRANQYANQRPAQRPWTPTEQPGTQPHGPPTVYQGPNEIGSQQQQQQQQQQSQPQPQPTPAQSPAPSTQGDRPVIPPNALEQDLHRMQLSSSPPPAYSSVSGSNQSQSYPNEKGRPAAGPAPPQGHPASSVPSSTAGSAVGGSAAAAAAGIAPLSSPAPSVQSHPAFANDPRQQQQQQQLGSSPQPGYQQANATPEQHAQANASAAPSITPASPPPLPEGWIAHLDPNSGQYYYIHLPTQSTQWEFPKGPTPLNLNETPLSPVGSVYSAHPLTSPAFSTFGGKPLASPGIPMTPMYEGSVMGLSTAGTVSGPPPVSGVELYKVAATNGVYFGPYLRYCNMDLERGLWLGSILLVTDAPQPPTIHIHQSVDLSPNPRQLKALNISQHQRWVFYKYDIDLQMDETGPAKWTYAITSHLGCTRYEFLVAGRHETNWRFIATSGNDFALNVNANERARLGGVGFMWKDIMQKHAEVGGFHCQLGLGGQIFADRIWKEIPLLKQWLAIRGKEQRKNAPWTQSHEEEVTHAYFHYYTSHFDQPHLREAFAQIPYILQLDDHDIFDGFGSYPQHMQFSNMFKNIGRVGIEMYLLFQHHTTLELLRQVSTDHDLFTITGTGWHFVKYLGPAVVVVGPDCRSERNPHQVMAGPTYQGLFPKIALLPPSVQHCLWMVSVPLIYPRLESTEQIANAVATGKKAVTGAYNLLGKVTSSVAGVVGAKDAVGSGFDAVKRAVGKTGLMGSVLNPFGEIDILDELRDQWTHESKDLERTYLIRTLQGIAKQKSVRMTFLSGAVNVCGAGLVHDPSHPSDHKTMYQLITAPVVNTPPSAYILKLLHNNKPLYVPANGQRSTPSQPSDTKEDMLELFQTDVTGQPREYRRLMGRRNYVAIVAYDPEVVSGTFGQTDMQRGAGKLSLAADFMVQGEGAYGSVVKYGPVIVPNLEFGR
ncbi:putative protein YGR266W [Talaromyces islandicus]|uniref:WW domain-containing protein n=1 Tax=Talaromyces islandicus TaxID=28573 RepID=A0A0U1LYK4_TALIS|nr:putative protein YGR266W [Talaromyces islandicus]